MARNAGGRTGRVAGSWLVVALAALACVASLAGGAAAADDPLPSASKDPVLPTTRCPVDVAIEGTKLPRYGPKERARVPRSLAAALDVRYGGFDRFVAPRTWRCSGLVAVSGGSVLLASPRGANPTEGIRAWREPACVGCIFTATCAYFPKESRALTVGFDCSRLPKSRHVTRVSKTVARYRDDDGEVGLVLLLADDPFAAGISCLAKRQAVCQAVLADWRAHQP